MRYCFLKFLFFLFVEVSVLSSGNAGFLNCKMHGKMYVLCFTRIVICNASFQSANILIDIAEDCIRHVNT